MNYVQLTPEKAELIGKQYPLSVEKNVFMVDGIWRIFVPDPYGVYGVSMLVDKYIERTDAVNDVNKLNEAQRQKGGRPRNPANMEQQVDKRPKLPKVKAVKGVKDRGVDVGAQIMEFENEPEVESKEE